MINNIHVLSEHLYYTKSIYTENQVGNVKQLKYTNRKKVNNLVNKQNGGWTLLKAVNNVPF